MDMYREMMRIRILENRISEEFVHQEMRTPLHSSVGQEAVAVGVCMNLNQDDVIYSNHRGHGHYIAKGGNMGRLVAELYNKSGGCSRGWGGSMHIMDVGAGVGLTSSIVGGSVPTATGCAMGLKIKKKPNVAVAFLGDGASEEGNVYESICFAKVRKLPIVYVCENNKYAMYTAMEKREPSEHIADKFRSILHTEIIDGNDVEEVYTVMEKAVAKARHDGEPSFVECKTYRLSNHYEASYSEDFWYRPKEEWEEWKKRCPIEQIKEKILSENAENTEKLEEIERLVRKEVADAFSFAGNSPYPDRKELYSI